MDKYRKLRLCCQGFGLIFVALASFCKQVFTFAGYGEGALQKQSGILDFRIFLIF